MKRTVLLFCALSALASCAQYKEPQANCFAFIARAAPAAPDCHFTPLGKAESDVEV